MKKMSKLIFAISLCLASFVFLSSRVESATCPNIQTMQNFAVEQYMGKWYEIQKYPLIWEVGQKCITANYTLNDNGTVTVFNSGVIRLLNIPVNITGLATTNATDPSKFTVVFGGIATAKLWVIDTDYVSYSLVYSCTQLPLLPLIIENAWILSRNPTLDLQTIRNLKNKLYAVNSPTFLFISTEQINCNHSLNNF